jgi:transcription-repair coupling factor (superfamily II helicase)
MSLIIPDDYVNEVNERLTLYKRLDQLKGEEQITAFKKELKDRFGEIPNETISLIKTISLREKAKKIGLEKLIIKNNKMVCKFTNRDQKYYESGAFSAVLNYVQYNKKGVQLKEKNNQLSLIVDQITTIESANIRLEKILK